MHYSPIVAVNRSQRFPTVYYQETTTARRIISERSRDMLTRSFGFASFRFASFHSAGNGRLRRGIAPIKRGRFGAMNDRPLGGLFQMTVER